MLSKKWKLKSKKVLSPYCPRKPNMQKAGRGHLHLQMSSQATEPWKSWNTLAAFLTSCFLAFLQTGPELRSPDLREGFSGGSLFCCTQFSSSLSGSTSFWWTLSFFLFTSLVFSLCVCADVEEVSNGRSTRCSRVAAAGGGGRAGWCELVCCESWWVVMLLCDGDSGVVFSTCTAFL